MPADTPDPLRCQVFDYTCDDCMLPANYLDFVDDPAYIEYCRTHLAG